MQDDFAARKPFFCEIKAFRCQKQIHSAELVFAKMQLLCRLMSKTSTKVQLSTKSSEALFVRFNSVSLTRKLLNPYSMKKLVLTTSDEREMHFIPENRILEVGEEADGTTTIAFVYVINVKTPIDEIRKEISKSQIPKIKWLTQSPQQ